MITFVTTYYNEPKYLQWWCDTMSHLNRLRPGKFWFVVVDDGSMATPAFDQVDSMVDKTFVQLYRITDDVGFNSHGARNLAMKVAPTDWVALSDIDRRYPQDTLTAMVDDACNGSLTRGNYYKCVPIRGSTAPSVNDFVVHKGDYWEAGGYDEEFVTVHWGDRLMFKTLDTVCRQVVKDAWKIKFTRHARNVSYADVPITLYPDDRTLIHPTFWRDSKLRGAMIEYVTLRNTYPDMRRRKPILQFPWERLV